jgi:hypothetical protein
VRTRTLTEIVTARTGAGINPENKKMLGVSTIGNATLIAYEDTPIIATDPWFGDENPAYFGSWGLSHHISPVCKKDILNAKYIWFSHGHPDHLNVDSLQQIRGKHILLPDHVGGRIANGLGNQGFGVTILPDRRWVNLSPRIRVFCITTMIQDSVLLVEVNKRLFVNLNDAGSRDCTLLIRKIVSGYRHSYLMAHSGYGDADMINFYDDRGVFIIPGASQKPDVGRNLSMRASSLGIRSVVPFSSFHSYRRTDSVWAQSYVTPLEAYSKGFNYQEHEFVSPFSHIDCVSGEVIPLNPPTTETALHRPEEFGDNWSDLLERGDLSKISDYFRSREIVRDYLSFINFRVGGRDNFVSLDGTAGRGITFEVPRTSLMTAIEDEIFDDLLIGNFMKTTLHNINSLYDGDFNFAVTKFGDNGRAKTHKEVNAYLKTYKRRARVDWYYARPEENVRSRVVAWFDQHSIPHQSPMYRLARSVYRMLVEPRH